MNIIQADLRTQRQLYGMLQVATLLDNLDSQVLILSCEGRNSHWISRQLPLDREDVERRFQKINALIAEHLPDRDLDRELIAALKERIQTKKRVPCVCGRRLGCRFTRHCVGCGLLNPRFDPLAYFDLLGYTIETVREESCFKRRQHARTKKPQKRPYCPDCGTRR